MLLSAAILWTVAVIVLCLVSFNALPTVGVTRFDKFGHLVFHFGIVALWYPAFRAHQMPFRTSLILALIFSFLLGVVLEICQSLFTLTRKGDILDVMANLSGALIAGLLIGLLHRRMNQTSYNKR